MNRPTLPRLVWRVPFIALIFFLLAAVPAQAATAYRFERFWPPLQQPWYFERPSGIAVDRDDFVYVTDIESHRVRKFTSDGKLVGMFGEFGVEAGQFQTPSDIAAGPQGFLYVADSDNGRIQKFAPDGRWVDAWPVESPSGGGLSVPTGIAGDGLGFLYVVDAYDLCVHKFTADGAPVTRWRCLGFQSGDPSFLFGITAAPDGFVYVSDPRNHRVQKFRGDGTFVAEWGELGEEPGQFDLPAGLALDPEGNLLICDRENDRIQKFSPAGDPLASWGAAGSKAGEFLTPAGIAMGNNGRVYIADWNNRRVQVFSPAGEVIARWESRGEEEGRFDAPKGIAADGEGNLYVADINNNRVQKFDGDGQFLNQWDGGETAEGVFNSPIGVAVYTDAIQTDRIFVADTLNHQVRSFTLDGEPLETIGAEGTGPGEFFQPFALSLGRTTDGTACLFVTDRDNFRVQKFCADADGKFVFDGLFGEYGTEGDGKFIYPDGIACHQGEVAVVDSFRNVVQWFDFDGNHLRTQPAPADGDGRPSLSGAAAGTDALYVADAGNHRILRFPFSGDGPAETVLGGFGYAAGNFRAPDFLCFSEDRLYVSDTGNNRIQAFQPVNLTDGLTKAILVAGGGPYPGNPLWDATRMNAIFAHRALNYRGIPAANIRFLIDDAAIDLNGDGEPDSDVIAAPTRENLAEALSWAADADTLVLYLVDHGGLDESGEGIFRLSPSETISASALDQEMDALQRDRDVAVIVIYDACKAGGFPPRLVAPDGKNRIVLASTGRDEDAHFLSQGTLSFSHLFWTETFNGADLKTAFTEARQSIAALTPYQRAEADANGDGQDDEGEDYAGLENRFIGNPLAAAGFRPLIENPSFDPIPGGAAAIRVTVEATNAARVWAVVRPPGYDRTVELRTGDDSYLELPGFELSETEAENRFTGRFDGFGEDGTYTIFLLARDGNGTTARPVALDVSSNVQQTRRAVIVGGYGQSEMERASRRKSLEDALAALQAQGYEDATEPSRDQIYLLSSPDLSLAANGTADASNLEFALADWGAGQTRDLVVFLSAETESGMLRLSPTETIAPETIHEWLRRREEKMPGEVTVILETGGPAEAFLPVTSQPDRSGLLFRPAESSGGEMERSTFGFSTVFWKGVGNGAPIGVAFREARETSRLLGSESDPPLLEANGNRIANEREDFQVLERRFLGNGIRIAENPPAVASTTADSILSTGEPVSIVAADITTTGNLKSVQALVSPPDPGDATLSPAPPPLEISMAGDSAGGFRGTYTPPAEDENFFRFFGRYAATILATDEAGNFSRSEPQLLFHPFGPDVFEDDDTPAQANGIAINFPTPQHHNFHHKEDVDWYRFLAFPQTGSSSDAYTIRVNFPKSTGSELAADFPIEFQLQDGSLETLLSAAKPFVDIEIPDGGIIYFRLSLHPDFQGYDPNVSYGYEIEVSRPIGSFAGFVSGAVTGPDGVPIPNATIRTSARQTGLSRPNGRFLLVHDPGEFTIEVEAEGYEPITQTLKVSELGTTPLSIQLSPIPTPSPSPEPPPDSRPFATIVAPSESLEISAGTEVEFRARVIGGDPPLRYRWDFDGAAESAATLDAGSIRFDEPGEYEIRFQAVDGDGDTDSARRTITVVPAANISPNLTLQGPDAPPPYVEGDPLSFTATVEGPSTEAAFQWLVDGEIQASTESTLDFLAPGPGEHVVTVRIIGPNGILAEEEWKFEVQGQAANAVPNVRIVFPTGDVSIPVGEPIAFEAEVSGGDPEIQVQWDFAGVAPNATELRPAAVVFSTVGTFPVRFSATDAEGATDSAQVVVTVTAPVIPRPDSPVPLFPNDQMPMEDSAPMLETAEFSHPLSESTHKATRWQIGYDPAFSGLALDRETDSPEFRIIFPIPILLLEPGKTYFWRAKFIDDSGIESEWSAPVAFEGPESMTADENRDGIPDEQSVAGFVDMDGDGEADDTASGWKILRTASGDSRMGWRAGENMEAVEAVRSLYPTEMDANPADFPLGLTAIRWRLETAGVSSDVSVHFTQSIPPDAEWVFYDLVDGWEAGNGAIAFAPDRRSALVRIQDGGTGDFDGAPNGVVVTLLGIANSQARSRLVFGGPPADNVGGAGCFLQSVP